MSKRKKYVYLLAGLLLLIISSIKPAIKIFSYIHMRQVQENEEVNNTGTEEIDKKLENAFVMWEGSGKYFHNGKTEENQGTPFMKDQMLYLPVNLLAQEKHAPMVRTEDVWYINLQPNMYAMMEEYNIYLENQEPVNMRGCPVEKDGVLYMPSVDFAGLFSIRVQIQEEYGLAVIGASGFLDQGDWKNLAERLKIEKKRKTDDQVIEEWSRETGLDRNTVSILMKGGFLYRMDQAGRLWQCSYTDQGTYRETLCSEIPDSGLSEGRYSTGEAGTELTKWDISKNLYLERKKLYRIEEEKWIEQGPNPKTFEEEKIMESLSDFMIKKAEKDTGTQEGQEDFSFSTFIQEARPGDFLLFKAAGADPKYGYFNHSALILDVDKEKEKIHVLHARSAELGVGADEEMDTFGEAELLDSDYWEKYEWSYLCTPRENIEDKRDEITQKAYEKYKGYSFGYGSWLGKKETSCAEIIEESYEEAGITLVQEDTVSLRLKEVLSGKAKNMVVVPDDLLLGDRAVVKAVWKKMEK